jgi:hypothetical protein
MRGTLIALSLLVTGSVAAQTSPVTTTLHPSATYDPGCPVDMSARQKGAGQTLWTVALEDQRDTANVAKAKRGGMGVAVELKAEKDHGIREATFEVSYVPPGARALLVDRPGLPKGAELKKKTFSLSAGDVGTLKLVGDLPVGRAAMIDLVHLVSLSYADGTQWHARNAGSCTIEPSRMVLVETDAR